MTMRFAVADDEQRRVVELQGVVGELFEGGAEVAAGFLFSPQPKWPRFQTSAQPSPPPAFWRRARSSSFPGSRGGDAEQVAEVVEMGLGAGAFGERVVLPGGDELFGGHGGAGGG